MPRKARGRTAPDNSLTVFKLTPSEVSSLFELAGCTPAQLVNVIHQLTGVRPARARYDRWLNGKDIIQHENEALLVLLSLLPEHIRTDLKRRVPAAVEPLLSIRRMRRLINPIQEKRDAAEEAALARDALEARLARQAEKNATVKRSKSFCPRLDHKDVHDWLYGGRLPGQLDNP